MAEEADGGHMRADYAYTCLKGESSRETNLTPLHRLQCFLVRLVELYKPRFPLKEVVIPLSVDVGTFMRGLMKKGKQRSCGLLLPVQLLHSSKTRDAAAWAILRKEDINTRRSRA